ncbi:MAG: hypothetical protein Q4G27_11130, partial [Flavobacteriaceae bacterium]|nr:hypothetical protein [Flavobacteriaceae bacterium]
DLRKIPNCSFRDKWVMEKINIFLGGFLREGCVGLGLVTASSQASLSRNETEPRSSLTAQKNLIRRFIWYHMCVDRRVEL